MKAERKFARTMRIDLLQDDQGINKKTGSIPSDRNHIDRSNTVLSATDFDTLFQSLYDAAVLTDFSGAITHANERALRFFDYRCTAIIGRSVDSLISGASPDILSTVIKNVKAERFTLLQAYCRRSDESLFPAEISVTHLRLSPSPLLCFFIRDITLRREVEEQLRIEQNAIQNAGSGIAITDRDGGIIYANSAMCGLWNCTYNPGLQNKPMKELFTNPQEVSDAIANAIAVRSWHGEMAAFRDDGVGFYVQTSITSCFDEDERLTHLVFSFADTTKRRGDEEALCRYRDHLEDLILERTNDLETSNTNLKTEIAERENVETELREAIEKLHAHDASKSLFVSNVSHELRTPLTSLIHAVENLMRGVAGPVPDPVYSYLIMMLEDCWRLDRTVCDILDLGRLESGSLTLNTSCTPFRHMVERTADAMRMEAQSVSLTLSIEPNAASGFVQCDAGKMERVITNLLSNAIKFTPAGGSVLVAILDQSRNGIDGLCCRVTDSGIGIPAQYINRVGERFFRVGEQVGGTGLGLSIAREIIERHRGALEILSPPPGADKGTQVSVWLPVVQPPLVMIVAHDGGVSNVITPALQIRGYRVACYESGRHALQVLHDDKQSAVIIDSLIPDMDGIEIVMHVKADAQMRAIPLFFLSEENPEPVKSSILQNFEIPMFFKGNGMKDLVTAVEDAFLPTHNNFTVRTLL